MKYGIAGLAAIAAVTLGLWIWMYGAYERTEQRMFTLLAAGDGVGAVEAGSAWRDSYAAYAMRHTPYLGIFEKRIRYHEGVGNMLVGDDRAADEAFLDAAEASEADIAAQARYNLASSALGRNDLEAAKGHLTKALAINPADPETKVNLELLLKKMETMQKPSSAAASDLWKLGMPPQNGDPNSGSKRSYR